MIAAASASTPLYTRLISGLFFPLHERLKGHNTVSVLEELEATQWWSPEHIVELQIERLRELLCYAQQHVPYYQRIFSEAGFEPRSVASLTDLQAVPFLTKKTIREVPEALRAENAKLMPFNTGGSTGSPLNFYLSSERVSHDVAAKWRATRWWGVDIGDPEVVVWGSPIELGAQDRLRALRDRLLRTRLLPAFEMSEQGLDAFLQEIQRMRPKMLFGYPSALVHLARHARRRGVGMDNLGIKVAFVTAERLYEDQRRLIEEIFACRVANGYGGRDSGFIAHECPQGGMHITAEDIIVEFIDEDGRAVAPGEAGEMVVTHLATRDYPFIRYRTGDIGILSDARCSCGRGLPLLKEIQGRTTDLIVASDGTVMHALALIYVIRELPGIESYKIVQEDLTHIDILIVPNEQYGEQSKHRIIEGIKARLGQDVQVTISIVGEILPERSGKHRYVVSKVAP